MEFNRLLIYGFGKVQLVRTGLPGGTVDSVNLTSLEPFVNHIKSNKPADFPLSDYQSITVIARSSVDYLNRIGGANFSLKYESIDSALLDALLDEIGTLLNI